MQNRKNQQTKPKKKHNRTTSTAIGRFGFVFVHRYWVAHWVPLYNPQKLSGWWSTFSAERAVWFSTIGLSCAGRLTLLLLPLFFLFSSFCSSWILKRWSPCTNQLLRGGVRFCASASATVWTISNTYTIHVHETANFNGKNNDRTKVNI